MGNSLEANLGSTSRSILKRFYVTAEEDQQIEQLCQGVSQSRYFRSRVLAREMPRPKAIVPQINREAFVHLTGIRHSLKRIANAMTAPATQGEGSIIASADWEKLRQLEGLIVDLQRQLKHSEEAGHDWQDHEE